MMTGIRVHTHTIAAMKRDSLLSSSAGQKTAGKKQLKYQDQRDTDTESRLLRLVTEQIHAEHATGTAAKHSQRKQRRFPYASAAMSGSGLVMTHKDKQ